MLEYAACRSKIKFKLWMQPGFGTRRKKEKAKERGKTGEARTTGVVIREEGKTYAELVRSIKENIKPTDLGVNVKSMRRTARGDVLVIVEGGEENAGVLKGALQEKVTRAEVKTRSQEKTLSISDIDPATSIEEVEEAIGRVLAGQKPQKLDITRFKEVRSGNMVATVVADKITADVLLRYGRIAIGWLQCRVRENSRVTRCFKCLEYGHLARACEGPDRTGLCFRCGGAGHKAQDCMNLESCILCKQAGHRADTARCPKWREAAAVVTKSGGRKEGPHSK